MVDLIAARAGLPGCRALPQVTAVTVRHFPGDTTAADAALHLGLGWPESPGMVTGADPWLAWRGPYETIALSRNPGALRPLLALLGAGRSETAFAADLSEALVVVELHGPWLDEWLSHLVDALSIPYRPGQVTRARLADVAVMMLRLATDRVWVLAERPIRAYVEEWLTYAHEGTFSAAQVGDPESGLHSGLAAGDARPARIPHAELSEAALHSVARQHAGEVPVGLAGRREGAT